MTSSSRNSTTSEVAARNPRFIARGIDEAVIRNQEMRPLAARSASRRSISGGWPGDWSTTMTSSAGGFDLQHLIDRLDEGLVTLEGGNDDGEGLSAHGLALPSSRVAGRPARGPVIGRRERQLACLPRPPSGGGGQG